MSDQIATPQAGQGGASAPARPWPTPVAVAHRPRLRVLQDEFVQRATKGRYSDAESLEWARLSHEHRMALMLLGGVDGDLVALANRDWRELPDPEREAIKAEARRARKVYGALFALSGRW